ncbi:hypothetical protein EXIGLDRAFT_784684 [Exidia glandulosa HHB12029]|uniref:Uncharacterized protein n=1 Tax=Exidia glandulosa HHB12029 TaxID=1314781 RepID=A0A166MBN4_EXIGL|nr:hypothetical protein EXIGLDRAFT_784684 [Exidia glandulosa HHB12029]
MALASSTICMFHRGAPPEAGLQTVPYTGYGRTVNGHDGLRTVLFTAVNLVSRRLYGTGTGPYTAVYRIPDGFEA